MTLPADRRLATLRAALGFLQLAPHAPELRLLHRWLDTWTGIRLLAVGVERLGHRLALTHVADGEWRAVARTPARPTLSLRRATEAALSSSGPSEPVARGVRLARHRGGAAVFGAALAVPLDDPALVVALMLGVRGGRLILDIDS
jgi:hypothetical protein